MALAVNAMMGSFCHLRIAPDLAHRGQAVHLRHHDGPSAPDIDAGGRIFLAA